MRPLHELSDTEFLCLAQEVQPPFWLNLEEQEYCERMLASFSRAPAAFRALFQCCPPLAIEKSQRCGYDYTPHFKATAPAEQLTAWLNAFTGHPSYLKNPCWPSVFAALAASPDVPGLASALARWCGHWTNESLFRLVTLDLCYADWSFCTNIVLPVLQARTLYPRLATFESKVRRNLLHTLFIAKSLHPYATFASLEVSFALEQLAPGLASEDLAFLLHKAPPAYRNALFAHLPRVKSTSRPSL